MSLSCETKRLLAQHPSLEPELRFPPDLPRLSSSFHETFQDQKLGPSLEGNLAQFRLEQAGGRDVR